MRTFKEFTESVKISLWLDDERDPNDSFIRKEFYSFPGMTWVKTAKDAIDLLRTGNVEYISFDHDLGPEEAGTGSDVALWIAQQAFHGNLSELSGNWTVHSANPIGSGSIIQKMKQAERFWKKLKEEK
jgi:hypothetical protein